MASTDISTRYNASAFEHFQTTHWQSYTQVVNDCCDALSEVWRDLGFQASEINAELEVIAANVTHVWQSAVTTADSQKETFRKRIHDVEADIRSIQEQLGHVAEDMITPHSPDITLKERLDEMLNIKNQVMDMKQKRIAEFKGTIAQMNAIRNQFGQEPGEVHDHEAPDCKISKADLDNLKCELESLCAERTRKMMRLETIWRPLKAICSELDEDPVKIASTVHPTFEFIEESFSGMSLSFSFDKCPSLSEPTFAAMEQKVVEMTEERSKRDEEMQHLRETLFNLWEALQTASDDFDRSILTRLMEGPVRLHRKTFDKVTEEIKRQETAKARILRDLVGKKYEEIEQVCDSGHLPLPHEAEDIMADIRTSEVKNPGHYADALACLTRVLNETTTLSEKRSEILSTIHDLESARSEVQWLIAYETDGTRYKGRDVNRKLQRAIKAGRVREKMPSMVNRLIDMLLEWEATESQPYIYDGMDFRTEVLEAGEFTFDTAPNYAPPPKNGKKQRSGRRSAVPEQVQPPQPPSNNTTAQRTTKNKARPSSRCVSTTTGDAAKSKIARPQSSAGFYSSSENDCSHLFKNAQTDYHPLQERLDKLLGSEKKASTAGNGRNKSGIPLMPVERSSQSETMSARSLYVRDRHSSDEDMLNTTPVSDNSDKSLPPPPNRLSLSALNKDIATAIPTVSSQKRTTF